MIDDFNGDEKIEFFIKIERVIVSLYGIIVDFYSGIGNGKKMVLIILGKIVFYIF